MSMTPFFENTGRRAGWGGLSDLRKVKTEPGLGVAAVVPVDWVASGVAPPQRRATLGLGQTDEAWLGESLDWPAMNRCEVSSPLASGELVGAGVCL